MDDSPDDLTVKEILETYFRVEDLQKVLKAFNLPFFGRKPELFERVLSLINHRQYELEFTRKAKRKITQIYRQRVAPEVSLIMAPIKRRNDSIEKSHKRHKSHRRYESDTSYEKSDESSEETSDEISLSSTSSKTRSDKSLSSKSSHKSNNSKTLKKKRRRVITSNSDSDENVENSDSSQSEPESNRRQTNNVKNRKNHTLNSNRRTTRALSQNNTAGYESSSDSNNERSERSSSSDSDIFRPKTRVKRKKQKININVSDDSDTDNRPLSELIVQNTNRGSDNSKAIEESDDDIIFIEEIPASLASKNRINLSNNLKFIYHSNSQLKESSSSDTESSVSDQNNSLNALSELNLLSDFNAVTNLNPIPNMNLNPIPGMNLNPIPDMNSVSEMNPLPVMNTSEPLVVQNLSNNNESIEKSPENNESNEKSPENNDLILEVEKMIETNVMNGELTHQIQATIQEFTDRNKTTIEDNLSDISEKSLETNLEKPETPTIPLKETIVDIKTSNITTIQLMPKIEKKPNILQQLPKNRPTSLVLDMRPFKALRNPFKVQCSKATDKTLDPMYERLPEMLSFIITEPEATINIIKQRVNGNCGEISEVEAIDQVFKLSLICPITNKRVVTPSRTLDCQHIDCFDIKAFIELNINKSLNEWRCPKCKSSAKIKSENNLRIDGLVKHILLTADLNCESVTFDSKAIWTPDVKKSDNFSHKAKQNDISLIDLDNNNMVDVIELDDDEDQSTVSVIPNSCLINSEIAKGKSVVNAVSNLLNLNKDKTRNTGPTASLQVNLQQSSQRNPNFVRIQSNSQQQIAKIARSLEASGQQFTQTNRQQIQTSNLLQSQQRIQTQRPTQQRTNQTQSQNRPLNSGEPQNRRNIPSLLISCLNGTNNLSQPSNQSSAPNRSGLPVVSNPLPPQRIAFNNSNNNRNVSNHSTNNSSSSSSQSASDHIKFDFNGDGNISCIRCQICNVNIEHIAGQKTVEMHINSITHKNKKINFNQNKTIESTQNRPTVTPTATQVSNPFIPSFNQRNVFDHNQYNHNQHSGNNNTFQYTSHFLQSQQPLQPQYSNYYNQQQYYSQQYQPSLPPPAHQPQPPPPPAHITAQNTSHYNQLTSSYGNTTHNQSYYPF